MKKSVPFLMRCQAERQTGAAAIELAIFMPILLAFLMLPIFFARVCWHYTIVQKAAQDAVRYLSTVPTADMMGQASAAAAGELAKEIIQKQIADIAPGLEMTTPYAYCTPPNGNSVVCGGLAAGTVPDTVRVSFMITLYDPFGKVDLGWFGLQMNVDYTMHYVGT